MEGTDARRPKITIVGDTYCDVLACRLSHLPAWGADVSAEISILAGGSGLNIAAHASTYKTYREEKNSFDPTVPIPTIKFFSSVGDDLQGKLCMDYLERCQLPEDKHEILVKTGARTGCCLVFSGVFDRSFVTDAGIVSDLSTTWFDEQKISSSDHIHISGFFNCRSIKAEAPYFFQRARAQNPTMTTSLNAQYDSTGGWKGVQEVCPHLTFFIGNEVEVGFCAGMPPHTKEADVQEEVPLKERAKVLLQWGCKSVVVTLGDKGAAVFFYAKDSLFFGDASPYGAVDGGDDDGTDVVCVMQAKSAVENVVDTTGAGDAFVGAFLVEWAATKRIRKCLVAGCLSGGAAVTLVGGSTSTVEAFRVSAAAMPVTPS